MGEKVESKYTAEVIAEMNAQAPLNFETCGIIGEKFDLPQRGVVASAKRNGIAYVNKVRVAKTGLPVVSKVSLVEAIAEKNKVSVESLAGLEKSTKSALEIVLGF